MTDAEINDISPSSGVVMIKTEFSQLASIQNSESESLTGGDFQEEWEPSFPQGQQVGDEVGIYPGDPLGGEQVELGAISVSTAIKYEPSQEPLASSYLSNFDQSGYQEEIAKKEEILDEVEYKPVIKEVITVKLESHEDSSSDSKARKVPPKLKKLRPAICTKCNTGFPSRDLYEHHMSTAHKVDRPYACSHCGKAFGKPLHLKVHERIHDPNRFKGSPKFACDMCDKRYHLKVSLEGHRKKTHLGYKPVVRSTTAPIKQHHSTTGVKNPNPYRRPLEIHPCPHCDRKFNWKSSLDRHIVCHTKERPFQCPICQQTFPLKKALQGHTKKIHETPTTPTGMPHPRPKWQTGQPCPCEVCGKVFKIPSQLRNHMMVHTGEKPFECLECGARFRLQQGLRHHMLSHAPVESRGMNSFKCRICGKEGYKRFSELQNHRWKAHRHIPYESEKEKTFACGVCGKPHFLRIQAAICAVLAHDPTHLRNKMFKHKCPQCPPESFGYHNLTYMRNHWKEKHGDKSLPLPFRIGMYCDNLKEDALPSCVIDKVKAENMRLRGIPPDEQGPNGSPLFVELDLLPIPEAERFREKERKKVQGQRERTDVKFKCEQCGLLLQTLPNLKRHVKVVHDPSRKDLSYKCCQCEQRFRKMKTLRLHEKTHQAGVLLPKRKVGRPHKFLVQEPSNSVTYDGVIIKTEPVGLMEHESSVEDVPPRVSSTFSCRFCWRRFINLRALRIHELRAHLKPWSTSSKCKRNEEEEEA